MARFEIDGHLGHIRFDRVLDEARALGLLDAVLTRKEFFSCHAFLWDFSGTEIRLDTSQLRALAATYRERVPAPPHRRKIALIAASPATRAKLMIMRSLLASGGRSEYQLFEREPAARLWLAVRPRWTKEYPVLGPSARSAGAPA